MRTLFFALLLLGWNASAATLYTEFYTVPGTGGNTNAGSTTGANVFTALNGNWDSTTGVYTPTDSSTPASSVTVGDWASVYIDAAATAVFIGRITAVGLGVNGTITVSLTAAAGTPPSTSATARTITVNGAWAGPSGASFFPFSLASKLRLTNSTPDRPRINFKNNQEYTVSAAISSADPGPIIFRGYTTTPGDGGRAVLTGNGIGSAVNLLTLSGNLVGFADFIVRSNGTSASASLLAMSGQYQFVRNCVFSHSRGTGLFGQGIGYFSECEAFSNNISNTALEAGIRNSGAGSVFSRCISHTNNTANSAGFHLSAGTVMDNCIAYGNGTNGVTMAAGATMALVMRQTDCYNNGGHGFERKGSGADSGSIWIENCNFIKNAQWGLQSVANVSNLVGMVWYCGFGSGTQANGSGTVTTTGWGAVNVLDSTFVTYASGATPWTAPLTGNFSIANASAWNTGRGSFVQTSAGESGTVGYPDLGAADHLEVTNTVSSVFAQ